LLPEVQQLVDTDFDLTKDSSGGLCFRDKRATKKHLVAKIQAVTISVVSWDFFVFLAKALGKTRLFDAVVFDESSMMKDPSSTRTRAARHIVDETVSFLALLTATPASNADEHVWAQASLVSPGILGWTITDFRDKYSEPATKNWQTGQIYSYRIRPSMRAQFLEDIARCSISVKPMLDVPLVERPIMVKLGEKARGAYRTLTKDNIWEGITAGSAGVLHSKQRQLASGFIYDEHGNVRWLCAEKGRALKSLLRDLGDEQVVIVHQFDAESDNLHEMLGDDVEDIKTPGAMARFLSKDLKYLSLHPKSAGHGVDGLQWVAKHMVFLSVPEDYELWVQTVGRVHRHGTHADVVTIWVLIGQDTIEEDIYHEVLPRKARRQAELLGACA
jgi:hypothetical protein